MYELRTTQLRNHSELRSWASVGEEKDWVNDWEIWEQKQAYKKTTFKEGVQEGGCFSFDKRFSRAHSPRFLQNVQDHYYFTLGMVCICKYVFVDVEHEACAITWLGRENVEHNWNNNKSHDNGQSKMRQQRTSWH